MKGRKDDYMRGYHDGWKDAVSHQFGGTGMVPVTAAIGLEHDYVDLQALAVELKVSERTLARYENLPDGLPSMRLGSRKLYKIASVRAWLEKRERKPNQNRERAA